MYIEDVELLWRDGCAYCRCFAKQTQKMFILLKDVWEEHKK